MSTDHPLRHVDLPPSSPLGKLWIAHQAAEAARIEAERRLTQTKTEHELLSTWLAAARIETAEPLTFAIKQAHAELLRRKVNDDQAILNEAARLENLAFGELNRQYQTYLDIARRYREMRGSVQTEIIESWKTQLDHLVLSQE
jgi:hypothetical protein